MLEVTTYNLFIFISEILFNRLYKPPKNACLASFVIIICKILAPFCSAMVFSTVVPFRAVGDVWITLLIMDLRDNPC